MQSRESLLLELNRRLIFDTYQDGVKQSSMFRFLCCKCTESLLLKSRFRWKLAIQVIIQGLDACVEILKGGLFRGRSNVLVIACLEALSVNYRRIRGALTLRHVHMRESN